MALKCAFCAIEANVVCHHCSKPLCGEHCKTIEDDPAFTEPMRGFPNSLIERLSRQAEANGSPTVKAIHCKACSKRYHWYLHLFR